MINEKGFSWPETILSLFVIIGIFGTLLPFASKLAYQLDKKKYTMHAAELAYQSAILYETTGIVEGVRMINGINFEWIVLGQKICVTYELHGEDNERCIG
ncbi:MULTISPECIES: hypothetical protein [Sporosarcina]|uniref:Type II secretion system protein n=1 Tax=Sporosarcina contaminans TaxID=633403 RepID=A0ABW3U3V4_9BACL